MDRPNWDEYFMDFAKLAATRATCVRRKVGAIIVKDKKIISTGYNGAPAGTKHCIKGQCIRTKNNIPSRTRYEICKSVHAEQNAIIQAAQTNSSTTGAVMYCTYQPCIICFKMIINSGIKEVVVPSFVFDEYLDYVLKETDVKIRTVKE